MKFTSNGIGRKNGFRFELRYGDYLDGQNMEDKWYLFCSRPVGKSIYNDGVYTERCYRFPTPEAAMAFCEKVASGEITLQHLREQEDRAIARVKEKKYADAEQKVDAFIEKLEQMGVNPVHVPKIVKAYLSLHDSIDFPTHQIFADRIATLSQTEAVSKESKTGMTLGDYMKVYQNDIDICVWDKDTGEHYLPALSYLDEKMLSSDELTYEPYEHWLLSLPLEKISGAKDCPLAVVKSDFTLDQTSFLLDEGSYETYKWADLHILADWAGADFDARLAYLSEGKAFEVPFDGTCMDVLNPVERKELYSMLIESTNLFITTYPGKENEYYAYSYHFNSNGRPVADKEIDIKFTEPDKGLVSSLDGKVYWSSHLAAKAREETLKNHSNSKTMLEKSAKRGVIPGDR